MDGGNRQTIMKLECDHCGARFRIDPARLENSPTRPRCTRCNHPLPAPVETGAPAPPDGAPGPPPIYYVARQDDCPLYDVNDEFQFSNGLFYVPQGKSPCLILARDVCRIEETGPCRDEETVYTCSGCTGTIVFACKSTRSRRSDDYLDALTQLLRSFPIFEGLERSDIQEIIAHLRLDKFKKSDYVLRKGEPGRNLFIIVSGKVAVEGDDGLSLATIGKGEVVGEMSVLSGDRVGASVQAIEPTDVLRISAEHFRRVLSGFPSLQMRFTRLLVRRMGEINQARSEHFSSSLAGQLSEIPPTDLFQTFNINQKTGVLTLKLSRGTAQLSFREGRLVDVEYGDKRGEEAFFELLKLKEGRFKYLPGLSPEKMAASEIGDFMYLVIEGLRRIEQDDRDFLRTVIPTLL